MPNPFDGAERPLRLLYRVGIRGALLLVVFGCGLAGFLLGAGVSDRAIDHADIATKVYYTLGLFVLGGMDLGVPNAGPSHAQSLLWFAYFGAPAITASAVAEGVRAVLKPEAWALRRVRNHIVIAGGGRLTLLYLARLRALFPNKVVVVVDVDPSTSLREAREVHGAHVLVGDIASAAILKSLRLKFAERIILLTGDDFANLDAAIKILEIEPKLAPSTVVHVSDLGLLRSMAKTRIGRECAVFNTHHIAASHVVKTQLLDHFRHTEGLDTVVLVGFGRFGQTVLDELQHSAAKCFDKVILVDLNARLQADAFVEEVGLSDTVRWDVISGDISDLAVWQRLDELLSETREPAFVLGSGQDGANLRAAIRVRKKYPHARVVARTFLRSTFGAEVAKEVGFSTISVADLIGEAMPDVWFGPTADEPHSVKVPSLPGGPRV